MTNKTDTVNPPIKCRVCFDTKLIPIADAPCTFCVEGTDWTLKPPGVCLVCCGTQVIPIPDAPCTSCVDGIDLTGEPCTFCVGGIDSTQKPPVKCRVCHGTAVIPNPGDPCAFCIEGKDWTLKPPGLCRVCYGTQVIPTETEKVRLQTEHIQGLPGVTQMDAVAYNLFQLGQMDSVPERLTPAELEAAYLKERNIKPGKGDTEIKQTPLQRELQAILDLEEERKKQYGADYAVMRKFNLF